MPGLHTLPVTHTIRLTYTYINTNTLQTDSVYGISICLHLVFYAYVMYGCMFVMHLKAADPSLYQVLLVLIIIVDHRLGLDRLSFRNKSYHPFCNLQYCPTNSILHETSIYRINYSLATFSKQFAIQ